MIGVSNRSGDRRNRRRRNQHGDSAAMTRKPRGDVTGAVRRSSAFCGDAQASVWRSAGDAGNQTKKNLACANTNTMNRVGDKIDKETKSQGREAGCGANSNGGSGGASDQTERDRKSSGRPNSLRDEIEWGMSSGGRCGTRTIGQTRSSNRRDRARSGGWPRKGKSANDDLEFHPKDR
jgi:hypothetical protein